MRTFKDYLNRTVEVIEIKHPGIEREKRIKNFIEEQDLVLSGKAESSYWLAGMKKPFYTSASEMRKRISEEKEKLAKDIKPERNYIPLSSSTEIIDTGFCVDRNKRINTACENIKNIPKEKTKKQEKGISYNMILRGLVAENGLSILEDASEFCRLLFGIPFEHGEGYTYQNNILSKIPNTFKFDYENGVRMLNRQNTPRKFVEYKKNFDGYYVPVLPQKCSECNFLNVFDVFTGRLDRNNNPVFAPRFKCECIDIMDAPNHDCLPDITGDYSIPVENLCANTAEKNRKQKSAWVQKIMNTSSYKEASGIDEDLEVIAPGNKAAKKELMAKYTSIEICFMAFELKQLEPKNEIKTEQYSEIYTDIQDEEFDSWSDFYDDTIEQMSSVEDNAELPAEYDIDGSYGVNAFNYIQPHYVAHTMKIHGMFDKCKTVQDMIDRAKTLEWSIIDWDEYNKIKESILKSARDRIKNMLEWIDKNPVQAKKRLTDISYKGVKPKTELNSDELNLLWKHLKSIIPKKKTTTVYM